MGEPPGAADGEANESGLKKPSHQRQTGRVVGQAVKGTAEKQQAPHVARNDHYSAKSEDASPARLERRLLGGGTAATVTGLSSSARKIHENVTSAWRSAEPLSRTLARQAFVFVPVDKEGTAAPVP